MGKIDIESLDKRLQDAIKTVKGKRPKAVIDFILEHGQATTEDLMELGYDHAPRAARDVRECGIPLVTLKVLGSHGKKIASYTFGDPSKIENNKSAGRIVLPKALRDHLCQAQDGRCAICGHRYEKRYFQVDHRVPYEIAGESAAHTEEGKFMAICASCQRSKSWSCEQCDNWKKKEKNTCDGCYWASPDSYTHVAGQAVRTISVTFSGPADTSSFDAAMKDVGKDGVTAAAQAAIIMIGKKSSHK